MNLYTNYNNPPLGCQPGTDATNDNQQLADVREQLAVSKAHLESYDVEVKELKTQLHRAQQDLYQLQQRSPATLASQHRHNDSHDELHAADNEMPSAVDHSDPTSLAAPSTTVNDGWGDFDDLEGGEASVTAEEPVKQSVNTFLSEFRRIETESVEADQDKTVAADTTSPQPSTTELEAMFHQRITQLEEQLHQQLEQQEQDSAEQMQILRDRAMELEQQLATAEDRYTNENQALRTELEETTQRLTVALEQQHTVPSLVSTPTASGRSSPQPLSSTRPPTSPSTNDLQQQNNELRKKLKLLIDQYKTAKQAAMGLADKVKEQQEEITTLKLETGTVPTKVDGHDEGERGEREYKEGGSADESNEKVTAASDLDISNFRSEIERLQSQVAVLMTDTEVQELENRQLRDELHRLTEQLEASQHQRPETDQSSNGHNVASTEPVPTTLPNQEGDGLDNDARINDTTADSSAAYERIQQLEGWLYERDAAINERDTRIQELQGDALSLDAKCTELQDRMERAEAQLASTGNKLTPELSSNSTAIAANDHGVELELCRQQLQEAQEKVISYERQLGDLQGKLAEVQASALAGHTFEAHVASVASPQLEQLKDDCRTFGTGIREREHYISLLMHRVNALKDGELKHRDEISKLKLSLQSANEQSAASTNKRNNRLSGSLSKFFSPASKRNNSTGGDKPLDKGTPVWDEAQQRYIIPGDDESDDQANNSVLDTLPPLPPRPTPVQVSFEEAEPDDTQSVGAKSSSDQGHSTPPQRQNPAHRSLSSTGTFSPATIHTPAAFRQPSIYLPNASRTGLGGTPNQGNTPQGSPHLRNRPANNPFAARVGLRYLPTEGIEVADSQSQAAGTPVGLPPAGSHFPPQSTTPTHHQQPSLPNIFVPRISSADSNTSSMVPPPVPSTPVPLHAPPSPSPALNRLASNNSSASSILSARYSPSSHVRENSQSDIPPVVQLPPPQPSPASGYPPSPSLMASPPPVQPTTPNQQPPSNDAPDHTYLLRQVDELRQRCSQLEQLNLQLQQTANNQSSATDEALDSSIILSPQSMAAMDETALATELRTAQRKLAKTQAQLKSSQQRVRQLEQQRLSISLTATGPIAPIHQSPAPTHRHPLPGTPRQRRTSDVADEEVKLIHADAERIQELEGEVNKLTQHRTELEHRVEQLSIRLSQTGVDDGMRQRTPAARKLSGDFTSSLNSSSSVADSTNAIVRLRQRAEQAINDRNRGAISQILAEIGLSVAQILDLFADGYSGGGMKPSGTGLSSTNSGDLRLTITCTRIFLLTVSILFGSILAALAFLPDLT